MLTVNVSSNYKKLSRSLDQLGKKQLPFAFSKTLNDTMFAVRKHVVEKTYPRSVQVRDRRFFSAIMRIDKSHKTRLTTTLRDIEGRDYLQVLTKGGIKRPRGGGHLAVPSEQVKTKRTGKGVPARLRPRKIVASPRGFVGKTRTGAPVIFERKHLRKRYPLRVVYYLANSGRIPKQFPFYKDAERITRAVSPKLFSRNFSHAIRTARR